MSSVETWLVTIVGGAIAAIIAARVLASFNAPVRERLWKPIGRMLQWPFTLRLTTATRQAATQCEMTQLREKAAVSTKRFREVCDLLDVTPVLSDSTLVSERIQRLQEASANAWAHAKAEAAAAHNHAQSQIDAVRSLAEAQMRDVARLNSHEGALARETAFHEGRAAGRTEAEAEVAAQRATPLVQPVWRIDAPGSAGGINYYLRNVQPDVDVSDVSVEASTHEFMFAGPTQTRGLFVESLPFRGSRTQHGSKFGVDFSVRWRDSRGDWHVSAVKVDREPRRAITVR